MAWNNELPATSQSAPAAMHRGPVLSLIHISYGQGIVPPEESEGNTA